MDTLFNGILQLAVKTLIVFLLARSSQTSLKTTIATTISKRTAIVRQTAAPVPPARRVAPAKKNAR